MIDSVTTKNTAKIFETLNLVKSKISKKSDWLGCYLIYETFAWLEGRYLSSKGKLATFRRRQGNCF